MAFSTFAATVLQNYISNYTTRMDKGEQRPSVYGALNLFKKQTADPMGILDEQVKANLSKAFNVSVQVPVINYKDVTITDVRTCAMQQDGLTSALVTLTAVTYAWGLVMFPMQHYENYVAYQDAFDRFFEAGLQKVASTVDSACIALLEANKNQYWPATITAFYSQSGDALRVPQASKSDLYNQLGSITTTMDYTGVPDIATNPIHMATVRRLAAQGAANSTNTEFQFVSYSDASWFQSNRITNGSGVESTLYAVLPGFVAIWSRVAPEARQGLRIHESKYWETLAGAPYIGFEIGVFFQADCTDASAIQASGFGNTNTVVQSWQFSFDAFYIKSYNSAPTTTFSPIIKIEILTT